MNYIIGLLVLILVGGAVFFFTARTSDYNDTLDTAKQDGTFVVITTARGDIVLALYPHDAPKTVANFLTLAESRFYDGTTFHRVVPGFVIQGGDPCSKTGECLPGTGGPGYTFEDEINNHKVSVGALAMANSGPNTNGSQFFIVTERDQPHLDGLHTVFGEVKEGMDVVRAIVEGDIMERVWIK